MITITPAPAAICFVPTQIAHNASAAMAESFSHKTLGTWLPALEDASGTSLKALGYARPVFEVISAPTERVPNMKTVKPKNVSGTSSMHIFTTKKIDIPAKGWFALHEDLP